MHRPLPFCLSGGMLLLLGLSGAPAQPIEILTLEDLQKISHHVDFPADGDYFLGANIDASETATWKDDPGDAEPSGFLPIGTPGDPFDGTLDGNGFVIRRLYIHRPNMDGVGLFGETDLDASIERVALEEVTIIGGSQTGALVGLNWGTVSDSYAVGTVSGFEMVGGLVGRSESGSSILGSYAAGTVTGNDLVGGVVGVATATVTDCYSRAAVLGGETAGGLVGYNFVGAVGDSLAAAPVSASGTAGGLVGVELVGAMANSYWDTDLGPADSAGGAGRTTEQLTSIPHGGGTYEGWDFAGTWSLDADGRNNGYPHHQWQTTIHTVEYEAGTGGSISGEALQDRIPGADGSEVTAQPGPEYDFTHWSDGVTSATRLDTAITTSTTLTAFFADTTPPTSAIAATANTTRAGATVSLDYTATDHGSGVDEVGLYVRTPGSATFEATGLSAAGDAGTFVYTGGDGNGPYEFATAAIDNAGNAEAPPTEAELAILWNLVENGDFSVEVTSADMTTTHPMTNDIDILVAIEGAEPGGTITVSRTPGNNTPSAVYDASRLIDEYITITGGGLGGGWTAAVTWNHDPGSATGLTGQVDTVFQFDGETLVNQYGVPADSNPLVVEGISSFSDWYAGDAASGVGDWILLVE